MSEFNRREPNSEQPEQPEQLEEPKPEVDKKKLEIAYKQLLKDKGLIFKIVRYSEDRMQDVIDLITEKLLTRVIDMDDFVKSEKTGFNSYLFRPYLYRNAFIEILRRKNVRSLFVHEVNSEHTFIPTYDALDRVIITEEINRLEKRIHNHKPMGERTKKIILFLIDHFLEGGNQESAAKYLNLTSARISQTIVQARRDLPEYSDIWDSMGRTKKPKDTQDVSAPKRDIESLKLLYEDLKNKEHLAQDEKAMCILLRWYTDLEYTKEMFQLDWDSLGLKVLNGTKLTLYKRKINKRIGRTIYFGTVTKVLEKGRLL